MRLCARRCARGDPVEARRDAALLDPSLNLLMGTDESGMF
jgi:hypothetical protein